MTYNIIEVAFGTFRKVTSIPINYKYDIGQILRITGLELPESYVVDFCNQGDSTTISMVGTADGVRIPDEFLQTGKPVKAYVVLSGADNTQTRYEITIPVNARPERTDIQPTPAEQQQIDSLIAAMNTAVEESGENADRAEEAVSHYPKIENGNWYVWNPETGEYIDTGIQAEGEDGVGIRSATLNADYTLTLTFTDGTSYTTPSIRGEPGQNGVSPTITVTAITGGHMVEITDAEGTSTFNVMDGETGATPNLQIGTVTTLPAGSDATAEITGTPEQPRLNLGIPEGQKGDPGEVTQAQLDTALANKADIITDTASGAIASFPDGADDLPLKSLVAQIEPVQDLHGYDSPWPAGGGKNKLRLSDTTLSNTVNGVSYLYDPATEKITLSGTNTNPVNHAMRFFNVSTSGFSIPSFAVGETYTLSVMLPSTMYCQFVYKNASNASRAMGYILGTNNFAHVTFTVPSDYVTFEAFQVYIGATATTLNTTIYFELSEGSAAPTAWTPYSNECPISGWTGAEIEQTGENLFDKTAVTDNAYLDTTTGATQPAVNFCVTDYIPVFKNVTVYIPATSTGRRWFYDRNKVAKTYLNNSLNQAFTPTEDGYIRVSIYKNEVSIDTYEINVGSTAPTTYHAYQGDTLSINWQDEAGTVYGGTLAINDDGSCKLTVTKGNKTLNGTETYYWHNSGVAYTAVTNGIITNATTQFQAWVNSDKLKGVSWASRVSNDNCCGIFFGASFVFIKSTDNFSDVASAKAWLTDNPLHIVYELAEPLVYHLPSVTMLSSLLGTNNIWVDTGSTDVEYRADTKKYIQKIIASALA